MAAHLQAALASPEELRGMARTKTAHALYEAQRITDHLVQLLALYKIEQAFYPFDPQEHALADLAHEVLARVGDLAGLRGIQMECDCPDDVYGWYDHELVFGVLVQALHNALRYTRTRVRLGVQSMGSGVRIRVEDDGPGYPAFLLAQGNIQEKTISFETGSTGLGLLFAKVVAELHKGGGQSGRLRLDNGGSLGGGCFILELP